MYFLIKDDNLLKKCNTIWDKVSSKVSFKKIGDLHKKFLWCEVKGFYNKEIPKVDSNHTCSALVSLDSALKNDKDYHPQVF